MTFNLLSRQFKNLFNVSNVFYILFIFVPVTIILDVFFSIDNTILFAFSVIAIIPLAKLVGVTTEHLAEHYGNTGGSLINVTFSNTSEIILSIVAIQSGLFDLVKANIVESILGQLLLVFGLSSIVGGLKFREQIFNRKNIIFHITLLLLSITILSIPTILIFGNITVTDASAENPMDSTEFMVMILSISFAVLLLSLYILSLFFTFRTHKDLFVSPINGIDLISKSNSNNEILTSEKIDKPHIWSKKKAIGLLAISMIGIAIISEILVSMVEETITNLI